MAPIDIDVLQLGSVVLPDSHPRAADRTCIIQGFVIGHPDGPIVVDTGVGTGSEMIDELFQPTVVPIISALNEVGVDERDVVAIANTHLHFDHCGQTSQLPRATVHVQRAEIDAAAADFYTVPEWAAVAPERLRVADGDVEIAPGVTLLATPGHTPGHQSVLVDDQLIVGQACFTCAEFVAGNVHDGDLHDPTWRAAADESLERLRSLAPSAAHFSHDPTVFRQSGN